MTDGANELALPHELQRPLLDNIAFQVLAHTFGMTTGQEQHIVAPGFYSIVGERMLKGLLLFEFSICCDGTRFCPQLPKNHAREQAGIGLRDFPDFGTECDLKTGSDKMFPGDRDLRRVKVV